MLHGIWSRLQKLKAEVETPKPPTRRPNHEFPDLVSTTSPKETADMPSSQEKTQSEEVVEFTLHSCANNDNGIYLSLETERNGKYWYSKNGKTWERKLFPFRPRGALLLVVDGEVFTISDENGVRWTSTDGLLWEPVIIDPLVGETPPVDCRLHNNEDVQSALDNLCYGVDDGSKQPERARVKVRSKRRKPCPQTKAKTQPRGKTHRRETQAPKQGKREVLSPSLDKLR